MFTLFNKFKSRWIFDTNNNSSSSSNNTIFAIGNGVDFFTINSEYIILKGA